METDNGSQHTVDYILAIILYNVIAFSIPSRRRALPGTPGRTHVLTSQLFSIDLISGASWALTAGRSRHHHNPGPAFHRADQGDADRRLLDRGPCVLHGPVHDLPDRVPYRPQAATSEFFLHSRRDPDRCDRRILDYHPRQRAAISDLAGRAATECPGAGPPINDLGRALETAPFIFGYRPLSIVTDHSAAQYDLMPISAAKSRWRSV